MKESTFYREWIQEIKEEVTAEVRQEVTAEVRQEVTAEVRQEVTAEVRQDSERSLILRQLTRRIGTIPEGARSLITTLSLERLESLGEALLDFSSLEDLTAWLQAN